MGIISTRVESFALSSSNINYTLNMNTLYGVISYKSLVKFGVVKFYEAKAILFTKDALSLKPQVVI